MAVPIPKLSQAEYLEIERNAEYKSEYYNGEMFAMAGGTGNHSLLAARMIGALLARLGTRNCRTFTSDMRVRVSPTGLCTYPDVTVIYGKPVYADDKVDVLTNPKLIIEVSSPSTVAHDRGLKFRQYKTIETLEEYVLVSQGEPYVECFYRPPGGSWGEYSDHDRLEATVTFKSLGIEIPLAEIYRDIEFSRWDNFTVAPPIPKLTPEQYLEIERKAAYKSEYFDGEMFAMAGGSGNHSLLAARFMIVLSAKLGAGNCKFYGSDMRVGVSPTGLYTYPDAAVVCGKPIYAEDESDVLTNPKVIIEVLSPSTEAKDRGFKFKQYKTIDSLEEYVLVSQFEPRIECYYRSPGGVWGEYSDSDGMGALVRLKSLGIEIPLVEIYRDIEFSSVG